MPFFGQMSMVEACNTAELHAHKSMLCMMVVANKVNKFGHFPSYSCFLPSLILTTMFDQVKIEKENVTKLWSDALAAKSTGHIQEEKMWLDKGLDVKLDSKAQLKADLTMELEVIRFIGNRCGS